MACFLATLDARSPPSCWVLHLQAGWPTAWAYTQTMGMEALARPVTKARYEVLGLTDRS
jgi:hypothetical protein